ncbi:response regulator [Acetobacteraceae bacterium H6797]|nr:response regulator [Acetobacteraceae bacterium H6797]
MSITVLIVEDELITRMALAMTLRAEGLQVVEAVNADDAWAYLLTHKVDLLFSDVRMKGSMDGVGLARLVRERFPDIKIILTSGHYSPEQQEDFYLFLPKPYEIARMPAIMAGYVDNRATG